MKKEYPLVIRRRKGKSTVKYYKTYDEALRGLMEYAKKELPLEAMVDRIRGTNAKTAKQKALLAPKYRESVARFWSELFSGKNLPSKQLIDYSDYVRDVPDDEDELLEWNVWDVEKDWEELCSCVSYTLGEGPPTCSEFDEKLGFYFMPSSRGFFLQVFRFGKIPFLWARLGSSEDRYVFTLHFENTYGHSPLTLDFFILPPMTKLIPSTKATSLMVLDALYYRSKIKPQDIVNYVENMYMHSFLSFTNGVPAACDSLSARHVYRQIDFLKKFGYDIESETPTVKNENGVEIKTPERYFYIKDPSSEFTAEYPSPVKKDWNPTLYPVIILLTLRNCEKPLPVYSRNPQNDTFQKRILERYGIEIDRKAIDRHIDVLILMGYSIRRDKTSVFMDKKDLFPYVDRECEFTDEYYYEN